jgi:creatinine amidohydrolase
MCLLIKSELKRLGIRSVIAPPYYFGMNVTTQMFPGTISIQRETMAAVLTDLMANYQSHGFLKQFILNHHGDPPHNDAIIQSIRSALKKGISAVLMVGGLVEGAIEMALEAASDPLPSDAILKVEVSGKTKEARKKLNRSDLHIHAEERETSLIMKEFPELIRKEIEINKLKPVNPEMDLFLKKISAGKWRELSPLGYIGDPSVATKENAQLYKHESQDFAHAIASYLKHRH